MIERRVFERQRDQYQGKETPRQIKGKQTKQINKTTKAWNLVVMRKARHGVQNKESTGAGYSGQKQEIVSGIY